MQAAYARLLRAALGECDLSLTSRSTRNLGRAVGLNICSPRKPAPVFVAVCVDYEWHDPSPRGGAEIAKKTSTMKSNRLTIMVLLAMVLGVIVGYLVHINAASPEQSKAIAG